MIDTSDIRPKAYLVPLFSHIPGDTIVGVTVDLTDEEKHIALEALWNYRVQSAEIWGESDDQVRMIDAIAKKVGGDPGVSLYGLYR